MGGQDRSERMLWADMAISKLEEIDVDREDVATLVLLAFVGNISSGSLRLGAIDYLKIIVEIPNEYSDIVDDFAGLGIFLEGHEIKFQDETLGWQKKIERDNNSVDGSGRNF